MSLHLPGLCWFKVDGMVDCLIYIYVYLHLCHLDQGSVSIHADMQDTEMNCKQFFQVLCCSKGQTFMSYKVVLRFNCLMEAPTHLTRHALNPRETIVMATPLLWNCFVG